MVAEEEVVVVVAAVATLADGEVISEAALSADKAPVAPEAQAIHLSLQDLLQIHQATLRQLAEAQGKAKKASLHLKESE